jgi:entericidin B
LPEPAGRGRRKDTVRRGEQGPLADCAMSAVIANTKGTTMKMLAMLFLALSAMLTGCNTIEGAGRDIERGGEEVQDTARDVKRNM